MLKPEQSPFLGSIDTIGHGFFGRQGGFSPPPYDSLNFSLRVGDDPSLVAKNRLLALGALDFATRDLLIPSIVHGTNVLLLEEDARPEIIAATEADALISNSPRHVLGVTYADCLPIAVSALDGSVVAMIHAGWRGVLYGVIEETIKKIHHNFGNTPLAASIGPAISPEAFSFGCDGFLAFLKRWPHFTGHNSHGTCVDLSGIARQQLLESGVIHIDKVGTFTDLDPRKYFSHRRDLGQTGRHMAIIAKK